MIKHCCSVLAAGALLAAPAFGCGPAPNESSEAPALERYISTKLDCDNMSQLRKDMCLQRAEEEYRQALKS